MNIGIIGYGNIAEAMVEGILKKGYDPNTILVSSRNEKKIKKAINELHIQVTRNNLKVVEHADILIIAVKPMNLKEVLVEIKDHFKDNQILISVVSSIEVQAMEAVLGRKKIIRAMLNTPVMVSEGMSALSVNEFVDHDDIKNAYDLFSSFGAVDVVEERYMDVITAISGTSPAYVFMMIEAMSDGGVLMGMPRRMAYKMAAQAVKGAAKLVLESDLHPGALKDMVCSPGGSTIDGVYTLESNNFRGTLIKTIKDATEKVTVLSKKLQIED